MLRMWPMFGAVVAAMVIAVPGLCQPTPAPAPVPAIRLVTPQPAPTILVAPAPTEPSVQGTLRAVIAPEVIASVLRGMGAPVPTIERPLHGPMIQPHRERQYDNSRLMPEPDPWAVPQLRLRLR